MNEPSQSPPLQAEESDDAIIGQALRWSLVFIVAAVVVGAGIAYRLTRGAPAPSIQESKLSSPEIRERSAAAMPDLPWTDITQSAGIIFAHENGAAGEKLLPETMGGGCAFFDYDNDGDQDVLLVNSCNWPSGIQPSEAASSDAEPSDAHSSEQPPTMGLFRNDGSGSFEDVTAAAGLDVSFYGMGVATGDFDNDGNVDVFLSSVGPNRLFRNVGGRFVDVTQTADVAGDENEWSTSCGWLDHDEDGDLDLFVCNYLQWNRDYDLAQNFRLTGGERAYGRPQSFEGTYPNLYRNEGDGTFTDISAQAGIEVDDPSRGVPLAKSLGVSFVDFDRDAHLDILVSNDTVRNFLYHNQGDGTFLEIGRQAGVAFDTDGNARGAMGIDAAHFRNNDALGIAIGNFSNEMTALYVSYGDALQFTDEAVPTGLGPQTRLELTFGVFFFDCDLDGRLDLFAANGHLEEDINKVQQSQHYEQPPQLFWNCGHDQSSEFLAVPESSSGAAFSRPMVGRGASFADIDADGDLDVLIMATGQPPRLLRNDQQTGHHWLRVKLEGSSVNHDAIGAWVDVQLASHTLRGHVMPTRSYLSQVELPVTFGLGDEPVIEQLRIHWPDGSSQVVADVAADRLIVVRQASE